MLDRFQSAFAELIAGHGPVVVQGGIWTFAHALRLPAREIPARLLDAMLEAVGPSRTLIMPSYTFAFARTRVFNLLETPGETGILTETMRARPQTRRTMRGFYSHLAIGPDAGAFKEQSPVHAWGEGSDAEAFLSLDAIYVSLGLPWHDTCSLLHMPELLNRVPYRYFKKFSGIGIDENGREIPISETMYVRSLRVPAENDFSPATSLFLRSPLHKSAGDFPMYSMPARTIVAECMQALSTDPMVFVTNKAEVENWINEGKKEEIEALSEEENAGLN